MIYTIILAVIHLFNKEDLIEVDLGFDITIPYGYSTQEELDNLV